MIAVQLLTHFAKKITRTFLPSEPRGSQLITVVNSYDQWFLHQHLTPNRTKKHLLMLIIYAITMADVQDSQSGIVVKSVTLKYGRPRFKS